MIWDDSIGEGDNIYYTTDLSLIDETTYDINSDENSLESDTYFFTDNQRKLEEIFNSQESDSTTEQNSENSKFESTYAEFIDQKNITLNAENMFKDCKVIETIDFIDFDISRIYNMKNMFYSCESLTHVYHFYPENVEDFSFLFYNCYELTYIEFNNSE